MNDDRSPMARGMQWASHVSTIALVMVLPGLLGLWIDRRLGTVMVFLVLGIALGMTVGMVHLVRLAKAASADVAKDGGQPPRPTRFPPGSNEDERPTKRP